jgi:type IV secretory pathway VirB3-like protein
MIVIMRKSNVILISLIFALLLAIYSLNMNANTQVSVVTGEKQGVKNHCRRRWTWRGRSGQGQQLQQLERKGLEPENCV